MSYFDINKKEHILDQLVVTKTETLINLLAIINKHERISQSDLRKESQVNACGHDLRYG